MKKTTKFLSMFLAVIMFLSIIPLTSIEAEATNGIQTKIDLIKTLYNTGSYFTSDGKSHNMYDYSVCPEDPYNSPMPYRTCKCSLSQNTKKTTGLYSGAEVASILGVSRWQCAAFATYVFYNIFNKDYGTCGTVSINNAKLGDVVVFDFDKSSYSEDHYAIYLYSSGSNVYVYDANSDYKSKVVYGSSYAKSAVIKVFRASNYDSVNNSATPPINYVTGLEGQYYIQGKSTGEWLSVIDNIDASTQPINTCTLWHKELRVNLVAAGNGYKMNFPLVSSLLVNPYSYTPAEGTIINLYADENDITQYWGFEKVGDAYVIRNLYNPSLVLTDNGVNQATLTTYTGASNQLWYLYPYTYTVTYNANGGSGVPSDQTKEYGVNLTLSSTKPTRAGYAFLGWSTSSTATSATYQPGDSFTDNTNTTLYAVWTQDCDNGIHNYSYSVTKLPTETTQGTLIGTCINCPETVLITLPRLGMSDYSYEVIYEPTYTSEGAAIYTWNNFDYGKHLFDVTIPKLDAVIENITINTLPSKTTYQIGDTLDTTGLTLLLTYTDGTTESVTGGFTTSGFSSSSAGTKTVTVLYGDKTTTFTVVVEATVVDENTPQIIIDVNTATAGQTVQVSVILKNNPGIAGLAVSLKYDESVLTLTETQNGELFSGFTAAKNFAWDENSDVMEDGILATFTFTVADNAQAGDYGIDMLVRSCTNENLDDITILTTNGKITVVDFMYGDSNGDKKIDMKDVVLLRRYITNFDYDTNTSSVDVELGADSNGDGEIDMKDVVILRKYITNYDYDTESSSVVLGPQ